MGQSNEFKKRLKVAVRHKACAWKCNYPSCDPNCDKDNAWVFSQWKHVNCKKCLKHKEPT